LAAPARAQGDRELAVDLRKVFGKRSNHTLRRILATRIRVAHSSVARPLDRSTPDLPSRLRAVLNPHGYDYLISRPQESAADSSRRWPLLLFLHGAAERGSRVEDVARQGLPNLVFGDAELTTSELTVGKEVQSRFVIIAPQCQHYEVWNEQHLLEVLDEVIRSNDIDPTRVYLTGMSMGGFGAWMLGLRHPNRFAAIAPICGGGRIADISRSLTHQPEALRSLGVWAFHGANDRVVPLEESERMIDELRRAGVADVKFTVYSDAEHDAWSRSYSDLELYDWLLQHHR
jgi:predicted peptidase